MVKMFNIVWVSIGLIAVILYLIDPVNRFALAIILVFAAGVFSYVIMEWRTRRIDGYLVKTKGNADGGDVATAKTVGFGALRSLTRSLAALNASRRRGTGVGRARL